MKVILDGHERGVNWVSFHPTENYIVSASDDKKVKIWKYSNAGASASEYDTFYGHKGNVSCAEFV